MGSRNFGNPRTASAHKRLRRKEKGWCRRGDSNPQGHECPLGPEDKIGRFRKSSFDKHLRHKSFSELHIHVASCARTSGILLRVLVLKPSSLGHARSNILLPGVLSALTRSQERRTHIQRNHGERHSRKIAGPLSCSTVLWGGLRRRDAPIGFPGAQDLLLALLSFFLICYAVSPRQGKQSGGLRLSQLRLLLTIRPSGLG